MRRTSGGNEVSLFVLFVDLEPRRVYACRHAHQETASMVDRLRRSLEQLESPFCPDCELEMKADIGHCHLARESQLSAETTS